LEQIDSCIDSARAVRQGISFHKVDQLVDPFLYQQSERTYLPRPSDWKFVFREVVGILEAAAQVFVSSCWEMRLDQGEEKLR
jgi:hypothetical protein